MEKKNNLIIAFEPADGEKGIGRFVNAINRIPGQKIHLHKFLFFVKSPFDNDKAAQELHEVIIENDKLIVFNATTNYFSGRGTAEEAIVNQLCDLWFNNSSRS